MKPYHKISLIYLVVGVVWIIATDRLAGAFATDVEGYVAIQTAKGWLFVVVSSLLVYCLSKRLCAQIAKAEKEKRAVFKTTLEGSHHILLNYLNQMQLVTLEATRCPGYDPEILELAQRVSRETAQELRDLENAPFSGPEDIESFIYRGLRETRQAVERAAAKGR